MRLKFLFFPFILIISISLIWGFIIPEINNLRTANSDYAQNQENLATVQARKKAVEVMGNQLESDKQKEDLIHGYLPEKKVEERIISGINYLGADTGIALVNLTFVPEKNGDEQNMNLGIVAQPVVIGNAQSVQIKSPVETMKASITISGEYSKILMFLDKLEKMSIYNNVKSLTIKKAEKVEKTEKADNQSTEDLNAVILVDFGYLKATKPDAIKISKLSPKLDTDSIEALNKYITSQGYFASSSSASQAASGKSNPFLP